MGNASGKSANRFHFLGLLELDFLPLRWERFDLLIRREQFFERSVQRFLGLFHDPEFRALADGLQGYDLSLSGKMVFPQDQEQ